MTLQDEESLLNPQETQDQCSCKNTCKKCTKTTLKSSTFYCIFVTILCFSSVHYYVQKDNHYDFYVYAQQWPSALCKKINSTHHGKCDFIPKEVNTWVVHGLWPSQAHSGKHYGPFNCEDKPFDGAKVQPIIDDLHKYWPNLMKNKVDDSFWQHEWEKHGTCACQKNSCTELEYFKQGIELRNWLKFEENLKTAGIVPSLVKEYKMSDIKTALGPGKYQCYKTETNAPFQVIAQIETCHDLGYDQVECSDYKIEADELTVFDKITNGLEDVLEQDLTCDPGSYICGPYDPGMCTEELPVKILPVHMPMEVEL